MIILVDQDDVLADFDGRFFEIWRERYPDKFYVPVEQKKYFDNLSEYPQEYAPLIREIYESEGFVRSFKPISGGIDAVKEMAEKGHDVYICTSPLTHSRYCASEKFDWTAENMGDYWLKKLVITKDKTLVKGNILVDDKPEITGAVQPEWEHVLYDKSYNRHIAGKRRLTWKNWREILGI